jgi:putative hemolysin
MSDIVESTYVSFGIVAVLLLVLANGFFVAAEFSLVAVHRSRVAELIKQRRMNAVSLSVALDRLDANLAATQLGITISSLALGWIVEPALAHLIEPLLTALPANWETLQSIRECRHEQIVVSREIVDEIIGIVRKQDILDQVLCDKPLDSLP